MSVRKRKWIGVNGEHKEAWVVDQNDVRGKRKLRTFATKDEAVEFSNNLENVVPPNRSRNNILSNLLFGRGLSTQGFHRALREIVEEHISENPSDYESFETAQEAIDQLFGEWFGGLQCLPAAFEIKRNTETPDRGRPSEWAIEIHVYEIEIWGRIADHKLVQYGCIADGDGPKCVLHIVNRFGHETIFDSQTVAKFADIDLYQGDERIKAVIWAAGEKVTASGTQSGKVTPKIHTTRKEERAILRAVYELGLFKPGDLL